MSQPAIASALRASSGTPKSRTEEEGKVALRFSNSDPPGPARSRTALLVFLRNHTPSLQQCGIPFAFIPATQEEDSRPLFRKLVIYPKPFAISVHSAHRRQSAMPENMRGNTESC